MNLKDKTEAAYILRVLRITIGNRYSTPIAVYAQRRSINKKLHRLRQLGITAPSPGTDRDDDIENVVEGWLAQNTFPGE